MRTKRYLNDDCGCGGEACRDVSILTGNPGINGTPGNKITVVTAPVPVPPPPNSHRESGDILIDENPPFAWYVVNETLDAVFQGNLQGADGADGVDGAGYGGTSTTSLTIQVTVGGSPLSLTITPALAYKAGSRIRIADSADPENKFMEGVVLAYNPTNGASTVDTDLAVGSGTISTWNISIAGQQGIQGAAATDLIPANNAWTGTNWFKSLFSLIQSDDADITNTAGGTFSAGTANVLCLTNANNVATLTNIVTSGNASAQVVPLFVYVKGVGTATGGIKIVNGTGNITIGMPSATTDNDTYVNVGDMLLFIPVNDGGATKFRLVNIYTKDIWRTPSYTGTYQVGSPSFRYQREGNVVRLSGVINNTAPGPITTDDLMATIGQTSCFPARNTLLIGTATTSPQLVSVEIKTDGKIRLRGDLINVADNTDIVINQTFEIN